MRQSIEFLMGLACSVLAVCATPISATANDKLIKMSQNPADWVMPLGNYAGHRYSALDQINEHNVGKLQVAWMFSTGVLRGHAGAPLKVGNKLYVHTPFPNLTYALDLEKDGEIVWRNRMFMDPQVIPAMCCDTINRGLAYGDGKIILHGADTTVVAYDAKNGRNIWQTKNGDWKRGETGTAAPLVVKDKVIVGISGGEFGADCHLTALDLKTGQQVWRAFTNGSDGRILFDPEKTTVLGKPVGKNSSLKTWAEDDIKHGGGCAWGWLTHDPALNLIYYGTGNPAPWNYSQRPGDNKWTNSIIARDADTGMARWVYQTIPHDQWSYDATAENILIDMEIDGVPRKVLQHFDKNGFTYQIDRETGLLLSAKKFLPKVNWATHIDTDPNSRTYGHPVIAPKFAPETLGADKQSKNICPSIYGAKGPAPAAWHAPSRQFVLPTIHTCMEIEPFKIAYKKGDPYVGASVAPIYPYDAHYSGSVSGWSNSPQNTTWAKKERFYIGSGPLVTKGNLAFYGTLDGYFIARRLSDGEVVYSFKAGNGIIGNPISYRHNGQQYVAVLAGIGGQLAHNIAAGLRKSRTGFPRGRFIFDDLEDTATLGGQLVVFALPDLVN